MVQPVFRFAPSPNGFLHLGHAYSALLNKQLCEAAKGRLLLRLEDIDITRCNRLFEQAIYEDLRWLGFSWQGPVRHQSNHFKDYQKALSTLDDMGLIYPAFLSRGDIKMRQRAKELAGEICPLDPDGAPLYPHDERDLPKKDAKTRMKNEPFAWRLNMDKALRNYGQELFWQENGCGPKGETAQVIAHPELWGDVILARKDIPTSYHLSVVIDDALQGVSHIVRGQDLFYATALHRLLQNILSLPAPLYHHHRLILSDDGTKLSKSKNAIAIKSWREQGLSLADIHQQIGL